MYFSSMMFFVMLLAWTVLEMSLHWSVNVRVDLFLIYIAFTVQLIVIAFSKLPSNSDEQPEV